MGATKKEKNKLTDTEIEAGGNVSIGDKTKNEKNKLKDSDIDSGRDTHIGDIKKTKQTFNIYGMEASQSEITFFTRSFVFLLALFGIMAVVLVYWPNPEVKLASFFCGAFFALCLYFLIVLLKTSGKLSVNVNS